MAVRGQQNLGINPEVATSIPSSSQGHIIDAAVPKIYTEHHHNLHPLQQRLGNTSSRDCVVTRDNSPRFPYQGITQPAQQMYGGVGSTEALGHHHYEDFAGILGERLASGNLSEASFSDKVCSGHSSLAEPHGPRVKLMFSFGGKVIPRPGDGKIRYVGGDTRIISVYRHIKYGAFMQKMETIYGQPVFLKYQLPNEDLDALISISCDEDLENMMDEFDRLQTNEVSNRLRIFVFSPTDYESVHATSPLDIKNTDQIYMDAVNGMEDTRSMNMMHLNCLANVQAQQVSDTLITPQIPYSFSYVLPVVSSSQLAPSLVQPVVLQYNKHLMPRALSSSAATQKSPTAGSQVSLARQYGMPDVTHRHGDKLQKAPVSHFYEFQELNANCQNLEGFAAGIPSVNSKHNSPNQQFEEMRLTDSLPKSQHETIVNRSHYQDQMVVADALSSQTGLTNPTNILAQVDLYGRFPRVSSDRSLLALQQQQQQQQQQPEILGPIVSDNLVEHQLSDPLQSPLDIESPSIHPNHLSHTVRHYNTEARSKDPQTMDPIRLGVSDSLAYQEHACMLNSGPEAVIYNQQNQFTAGMLDVIGFPRPLTVQTCVHAPSGGLHPMAGQANAPVLYPGSAPSSPCVKFQGMDTNSGRACSVLVGCGGPAGGFAERPMTSLSCQPQVEPVLRGLKPLNIHVERQEQFVLGDERFQRQQLPSPLSKSQEVPGGFKQQGWDYAHSFFSEGFIEPRTPPYPGGSPCGVQLTPFNDNKLSRNDEPWQEHVHCDGVLTAYPNNQEGIDWTMGRQVGEKTTARLSRARQVDLRGEASAGFSNLTAVGNGPGSNLLNPSVVNPLPTTAATSGDVFKASFTPSSVIGPSQILNKGRESSLSAVFPATSDAPYPDSDLLAAVPETFVVRAALTPAPCPSPKNMNPNSFFVSDVEEGQWAKIKQDNAEFSEDSQKPEKRTNDSLHLAGTMCTQDCGKDVQFQAEQGEHLNSHWDALSNAIAANMESKANEAHNSHFQMPPSPIDRTNVEATNFLVAPSSPHVLAGSSLFTSLPHPFEVESSTLSGPSAEVRKGYECGNVGSCMQTDGHECLPSEHNELANLKNASFLSSPGSSPDMEVKVNLPIFDAGSLEVDETGYIRCSKDPANAGVALPLPTLYSAPTLSMQNWEDNLSSVKLEDCGTGKSALNKGTPENSESPVSQKTELQVKVGSVLNDSAGTNAHLNPAALAEAEAVSRGLQTIKNADLEELHELGTGTFGTVYHGKWRGTDVAIKRIKSSCFSGRPSERDRLMADFWKEAYILGQLHHPNVVAFYGVVPDGPGETLATVTEYMVNGSLKQVLHRKDRTIDRRKRLLIIMDAAFGMEYLHGKNIVHFDLKCENLLVNMKDPQRPICKVGDLGLSKVKHQTMVSGGVRGTLPWMAPELLSGSSSLVSEKVDVFSFGIVMWELLTGEEPYANMHYGAIIGGIVNNTLRPPVPNWCDPAWKSLMEKCWAADPGRRPTFFEIAAELRAMALSKSKAQTQGVAVDSVQ